MPLIVHKTPYISQSSNSLLLEGSLTQEEMKKWGYNICGLLCAFMVIKSLKDNAAKLQKSMHEAIRINAYDDKNGWIHEKLVELLSIYGIPALRKSKADLHLVEQLIIGKHLIIASVSPTYLNSKSSFFFNRKSGHLVLIIGMELQNNIMVKLHIHDPGSRDHEGGEDLMVDADLFDKNFAGNIIVIEQPQP